MRWAVRPVLRLIVVLGCGVTLVDLWLLEHTEDFWQWLPLALLALALAAFAFEAARPGRSARRILRATMAACVISGFVGLWQHYTGNREFELEMYPSRGGVELLWESLKGATPTLAPAAMVHLGLLGLLYGCAPRYDRDRAR